MPSCPACDKPLERVEQSPNSPRTAAQFEADKAGDWFCRCHDNFAKPWESPSASNQAQDAPAAAEAADARPEPEATPEGASAPQGAAPDPATTATVFRADVTAVQTLGGLESMRDFPVVSWHRYSGPNGDRYKALAWSVPLGLLDRLAITPLTHDQAQGAYLARKDRKAARRERILAQVS